MSADIRLTLFTRFPTPGAAKSRLIPAIGGEAAAAIHRRLTEHSLATMRASGLACEVRTTGTPRDDFRDWLGDGIPLVDQGEGDLGERLARVPAPVILLGADAPDLTVAHLHQAVDALARAPVVIGPAEDGGYYLLGLAAPMPFLFDDMPWGTERVFAETIDRLDARAIARVLLDPLADLDRPEDLARWPAFSA